jgi:hypothetical protein
MGQLRQTALPASSGPAICANSHPRAPLTNKEKIMEYAQLNEAGTEAIQVTTHGNVEWDSTHFCPAAALTPEEATYFRVVPLAVTVPPAFDAVTQSVIRNGCEKVAELWRYKWDVIELYATQSAKDAAIAAALVSARAALLKKIDADTDAIYGAVQGNRGPEYQLAEMDAAAYKAAGYSGSVPASVQSWATAKGQTTQWAADDILTTATAWRGAQAAIRSNRLARKEAARVATDLTTIAAQWNGFVTYIKAALGVA